MKKLLFATGLVAVLALSGCFTHVANEPILVGQLAEPQSEPAGRQARQGVELAVEELNRGENLPLGRHVKVVHVEVRPDPKQAEGEAVRLFSVNRVAALLCDLPREPTARAALAARSNEGVIVASSSFPGGHEPENVFATGLAPADQGQALAQFLKEGLEPRVTQVAVVLDPDDERGRAVFEAVSRELKETTVHFDRLTLRNESDLPALVEEFGKKKPGAVLVVGSSLDLMGRLRARLSAGMASLSWLYAGEEWQMTTLAENAAAGKGVYLATGYVVDNGSPRGEEFAKQYRDKFKQEPDVHAALAYDDARLLFEALGKTQAGTPVQVRSALLGIDKFDGVTGTIAFKDRTARRPAFVARVEEKGLRLKKKYEFGK